MAQKPSKPSMIVAGPIAENRRARFDYEILDTLEAGIVLTGTEVKSLRTGKAQITESYASPERGELWRSDDAGASWKVVSYDRQLAGRTHYYTRMAVAPDNPDEAWFLAQPEVAGLFSSVGDTGPGTSAAPTRA